MKIAVTRRIPEAGLKLLRDAGDVRLWEGDRPPSRDELLELARDADGILSLLTDPIDGELLDTLTSVRVVSNFAVGFDNIDVPACTERGVAACITPDVLTDTTADFAFALLLSVARRVHESASSVPRGEWKTWEPLGFIGQDVFGSTIGIIGMGRIGLAVAKRATGFGMTILYSDMSRNEDAERDTGARKVDIDQLLRDSDFVSVHTPLTEETRHLIGAKQLAIMKPTSVLINTARGPVVDTDALVDALESGEIWAAGLDVTDPEPLPADHPLLGHPRTIVAPHIASATRDTRDSMARLAATNLIAVLRGEAPPRCLNPEVLDRA
jgi:glyoxylate reductase